MWKSLKKNLEVYSSELREAELTFRFRSVVFALLMKGLYLVLGNFRFFAFSAEKALLCLR